MYLMLEGEASAQHDACLLLYVIMLLVRRCCCLTIHEQQALLVIRTTFTTLYRKKASGSKIQLDPPQSYGRLPDWSGSYFLVGDQIATGSLPAPVSCTTVASIGPEINPHPAHHRKHPPLSISASTTSRSFIYYLFGFASRQSIIPTKHTVVDSYQIHSIPWCTISLPPTHFCTIPF